MWGWHGQIYKSHLFCHALPVAPSL